MKEDVKYLNNKLPSVAGLLVHFLCCLVSAARASQEQRGTACAGESLGLFMKYLALL